MADNLFTFCRMNPGRAAREIVRCRRLIEMAHKKFADIEEIAGFGEADWAERCAADGALVLDKSLAGPPSKGTPRHMAMKGYK